MKKRLYRDTNDKKLCGVCSGIAAYFNIDPTLIRLAYALMTIFTTGFPGVIIYIILAFVMPEGNATDGSDNSFR